METPRKPVARARRRLSVRRGGLPGRILVGLFLLALVGWSVASAHAQSVSIYLKDGQVIPAEGMRRDGGSVLARIKTPSGGEGEIGYPVENILRIEFPEPPVLKSAREILKTGKTEEAARQIAPVLAYYSPFRDVPGNWWTPLALLQADAFTRLAREREADALLNEIARLGGTSAEILRTIKIKQAANVEHHGDHRKALNVLEPMVKDLTNPPYELSEAWLTIGLARLALHDYRPALLAFLHVSVFTPEQTLLMPPALLGSAGAYVGLEDISRAQAALKQLTETYPDSPEAADAKTRLQKLAARGPKPSGS